MTEAFERFKQQFYSKGRQKADGYDYSHFDGLTAGEKTQAFDLLENEIFAPETIKWLDHLDREKAVKLARDLVKKSPPGFSGKHRLLSYLHGTENDSGPIKVLMSEYHRYEEADRDQVVWMVKTSGLEPAEKCDFYRDVIMTDDSVEATKSAADFLLLASGYVRSSDAEKVKFYELRARLASDHQKERKLALDEI